MPTASKITIRASRVAGSDRDVVATKYLHTKLVCLAWGTYGAVTATRAFMARYILEGILMFILVGINDLCCA